MSEYNIEKLRSEFAMLRKFAAIQEAQKDIVGCQKIYVDMTGELETALVLDELVFFTLPRNGKMSGLRVWKDGVLWMAVQRNDWWDRKRLKPREADNAIRKLVEQGLIFKEVFKFNGSPSMHLRLNVPVFFKLYGEAIEKENPPEVEDDSIEKDIADLYAMMDFPFSPNGNLPNGDTDSPNGDTDSPNGEIINNPNTASTHPPAGASKKHVKKGDWLDGLLATDKATQERIQQTEAVLLRLDSEFRANIPRTGKNQDLAKWIIRQEKAGQPLDTWLGWCKSDQWRLSHLNIYAQNLEKIRIEWPQAFVPQTVQSGWHEL